MRKFIYLCGMMLLSMNMMAQIFDNNWSVVINDDFFDFVGWDDDTFTELCRFQGYQPVWECYMNESHTGVTTVGRHQAYQTEYAYLDDTNNKMTLKARHFSNTPLNYGTDYVVPLGKSYTNSSHPLPPQNIFYYSGTIETTAMYWFGYYEIKCKLPIHAGVKTSFWLFGPGPHSYEEIDIFEHSETMFPNQPDRGFGCGLWYNPNNINQLPQGEDPGAEHTYNYYAIDSEIPDLTQEHTYACEWLPDKITWFFDGKIIFEYDDRNGIPQYPKRLKVTHPVLGTALNHGVPEWLGTDNVTINYIKYYRLEFDCDTDISIQNVSDITNYQPGVKHSVTIGSSGGLEMPNNTNITFRASESISINNETTIPAGAQVTMIIQGCPNTDD